VLALECGNALGDLAPHAFGNGFSVDGPGLWHALLS
jgi:hypothetical protein